jgi:methionyl-tRNA synthetase
VSKPFFITTPIYYVNDVPHIGHAYCTIGADVQARYQRALGREVFFLTGTDEHGQKIAKTAAEKGKTPQELVDEVVLRFQEAWKRLDITNDDFIRTTEERHKKGVSQFFATVNAAGFLEKRSYSGNYCVHEETFWPETQLIQPGDLCPDCKRPTQVMQETNYFFKQSAFAQALRDHLKAHPEFVQPESRRNELLGSYLNAADGVNDISVTRSALKWGIPTPVDPEQVIYVWFDALINYMTAAGYGWDDARFKKLWPADIHLIGKDILRFHALLWPAMLMAHQNAEYPQGLPLPGRVYGTGLIMNGGVKMSKSLGNSIDPFEWADRYGVEVVRYYLLREVPFGSDGSITREGIENRFNSELANDWGNLLSRSVSMTEKYFEGKVPAPAQAEGDALEAAARAFAPQYLSAMDSMAYHEALEAIFSLTRAGNKYVDDKAPWKMAKDPGKAQELATTMHHLLEALRLVGLAMAPFMPQSAARSLQQLGMPEDAVFAGRGALKGAGLVEALEWGRIEVGSSICKAEPLFMRREFNKE